MYIQFSVSDRGRRTSVLCLQDTAICYFDYINKMAVRARGLALCSFDHYFFLPCIMVLFHLALDLVCSLRGMLVAFATAPLV